MSRSPRGRLARPIDMVICGALALSLTASATAAQSSPPVGGSPSAGTATGRLMFSRFDESTHTFLSTFMSLPDGTNETEIPLPGPEGGGRWSRSGEEIAVMTVLPDGRIGTAIITPDGTLERVLDIPDDSLNAPCTVWSPDDSRLACEVWDEGDASRNGIYTVRSSDGGDMQRLTTAPDGMVDMVGDYSPDGTQFVFKRTTEEAPAPLMLVDVAGGEPRPLSTGLFEDTGRFSPDGSAVLTSAAGRIVILDPAGADLGGFGDPSYYLFGPAWSPDGARIAFSRSTSAYIADIFTSLPDGSDLQQVTSTPANEITVDWGR